MGKRDKVERYYSTGLWSLGMVRNAVGRWITEAEFAEITGQEYYDTEGRKEAWQQ